MKIGLLGHGVVGSGVTNIIDKATTADVEKLQITKILVKTEAEKTDARMVLNADEILNDPDIDVVCECMGGIEPAASFVQKALENGKSVVTSNKKMLAVKSPELMEAAEKGHAVIRYEASCGGGIPWITSLERIRRIEPIDSFRGIFNGTTNYILSSMRKKGISFDEALASAQKLGYAERDPSDDVDGFDVRYKTALSAFTAFDAIVNPGDIPTWGIRTITDEDMENAEKMGRVVKLIGQGSCSDMFISLQVLPVLVRKDSVFADIDANYNVVESQSASLGKALFIGQGAGSLPTAHAVVQDLIDLEKKEVPLARKVEKRSVSEMDHTGVYYIRTAMKPVFTPYIDHSVSDNGFLSKKVSFVDIATAVRSAVDPTLFFAEVEE